MHVPLELAFKQHKTINTSCTRNEKDVYWDKYDIISSDQFYVKIRVVHIGSGRHSVRFLYIACNDTMVTETRYRKKATLSYFRTT